VNAGSVVVVRRLRCEHQGAWSQNDLDAATRRNGTAESAAPRTSRDLPNLCPPLLPVTIHADVLMSHELVWTHCSACTIMSHDQQGLRQQRSIRRATPRGAVRPLQRPGRGTKPLPFVQECSHAQGSGISYSLLNPRHVRVR
jgi:hypothetical protein